VRRGIALATVAALLALVVATLVLFVFVQSDNPKRADAIVVLSGDRKRLDTGLRLFHEHVAPTLVISRDGRPWRAVDALCAQRAILCFHASPYSTEGEAQTVDRMSDGRSWRKLVVVTSRYHLRRARILFERCAHRRPQVVAAKTAPLDYVKIVPWEWAKFVYQLTFDRSC
jgi:uncharacterized SAM-binding protein YcdF (DUF218 family)